MWCQLPHLQAWTSSPFLARSPFQSILQNICEVSLSPTPIPSPTLFPNTCLQMPGKLVTGPDNRASNSGENVTVWKEKWCAYVDGVTNFSLRGLARCWKRQAVQGVSFTLLCTSCCSELQLQDFSAWSLRAWSIEQQGQHATLCASRTLLSVWF